MRGRSSLTKTGGSPFGTLLSKSNPYYVCQTFYGTASKTPSPRTTCARYAQLHVANAKRKKLRKKSVKISEWKREEMGKTGIGILRRQVLRDPRSQIVNR